MLLISSQTIRSSSINQQKERFIVSLFPQNYVRQVGHLCSSCSIMYLVVHPAQNECFHNHILTVQGRTVDAFSSQQIQHSRSYSFFEGVGVGVGVDPSLPVQSQCQLFIILSNNSLILWTCSRSKVTASLLEELFFSLTSISPQTLDFLQLRSSQTIVSALNCNQNLIQFLIFLSRAYFTQVSQRFRQLFAQLDYRLFEQGHSTLVFQLSWFPCQTFRLKTLKSKIYFPNGIMMCKCVVQRELIEERQSFDIDSTIYNILLVEMNKIKPSHHKANSTNTCHSSTVSFDSFLFVDNVTNSRIVLKEARKHYEPHKSLSKHKIEEKEQLNTLHECLSTLKSTKLFQMHSLRNKIFKSTHNNQTSKPHNIQQAKRGIRHLIEASINELSLRQLRACFSDPAHKIDPRIIALQSLASHQLTKQNIQSLLNESLEKENQKSPFPIQQDIVTTQDSYAQEFKQEKVILEQANNYMQNHLKSNSTHLIKPKKHRQLYEQLFTACSGKRVPKKAFAKPTSIKSMDEGVFKPFQKCESIKKLQKKAKEKEHLDKHKTKEIIFAVQNNLFFDVQTLIMMNKQLIYSVDPQGNNLLHIAAKNRNEQLFSFILRKAGGHLLYSKNNLGRTPLDLAKLYAAHQIVKICQNYSPYSY